jgi:uncharacterized protein YcbK (DUF882 family)
MGDISENFSRREFACKCGCGFDTVDAELLGVLQDEIRGYFGQPVQILSGCRCFEHNLFTAGAASNSLHVTAKAADIQVKNIPPRAVYQHLNTKHLTTYGLGLYHNRIHIDVRADPARWNLTAKPAPGS